MSNFDIIVMGATPAGIAASIAAARLGNSVVLIEKHAHLGGMTTSGLGKSDIENKSMIKGLFDEFVQQVYYYYKTNYAPKSTDLKLCHGGYYFEPSVAESILDRMVAEQDKITVLRSHQLDTTLMERQRANGIVVLNRKTQIKKKITGQVVIDATYEGDILASAGARYRMGRESRDDFNEPHAGIIYFDYQNEKFLPGTTHESDTRLPAYTFRLCLTTNPCNAYRVTKAPANYDRSIYIGYLDDLKSGRLGGPRAIKPGRGYYPQHFDTLMRSLSVTALPNQKTDVNMNPRPLSFPFAEENLDYVDGDAQTREKISSRIRDITLGLLWFIQHDKIVPEPHRSITNQYHLPLDEFTDNQHFPFQLYVREARRLAGLYVFTENDVTNGSSFEDSIAVSNFPIDSFPVRKRQQDDNIVLEGYLGMLEHITRPYQIPYRIMIPEKVNGLIVPVAASTTHVAYSSIRMEPTWMAMGQAAGVAAHLSVKTHKHPRNIEVKELQKILRLQNQILDKPR